MIRIDVLPDDVLLDIFDFCAHTAPSLGRKTEMRTWQLLVKVCRRWRSLIFGSPRRLHLRLFCTPRTPTRDTLDVWPPLPLYIWGNNVLMRSGLDNIVIALGQSNRVFEVILEDLGCWQLENILAVMQVPFPELRELHLFSNGESPPVVPDSFLGGSAPCLRSFKLSGISFPGLPKLLLSATHLVDLYLLRIPLSGYISPEAMADLLSVLSSLQTLFLALRSPQSRPNWESRRPLPLKRSVSPALNGFCFDSAIEYLEDLVTYIDTPQLSYLNITFDPIDFDGPRLAQIISRTPILAGCDAHVEFDQLTARVRLPSPLKDSVIGISFGPPNCRLSSVAQACNSGFPPLSMIEDLYIVDRYSQERSIHWKKGAIEDVSWLELLLPFPAVKNLYLSKDFMPGIAASLQEVVGTEVLPNLQNIFVEELEPSGPFQESIGQFVAARELSGHPITISVWDGLGR